MSGRNFNCAAVPERVAVRPTKRLAAAIMLALAAGGPALGQTVDLGALGNGGFALDGVAAADRSGRSVSGAGDVNGDGLADLIVGAYGADPGGESSAGTSYVVFGKANGTTVDLGALGNRGFAIEGVGAYDGSGRSVSGAGDVNGDGLADLIVGAPYADLNGETYSGTSYVVFGKANGTTVDLAALGNSGFAIEGAARGGYSGRSVSGAGDVNGDGLADLIVGADRADPGGVSQAGTSYVVFGKATSVPVDLGALGAGGFAIEGAATDDRSGISVAGAGDVNGDGLADLIVGATGVDPSGKSLAGTSYVVFGKANEATVDLGALGTGGFAIEGAAGGDLSGISVSGAGDVNGDGLADLIVGAFFADSGGRTAAGTSYVVFGKANGATVDLSALGSSGFAIEGAAAGDRSGESVSGAGDVNGDGLADLIVGAVLADPGGETYAGTSYVVFGKANGTTVDLDALGNSGFAIEGAVAGDRSGGSVSGAGDVNGDGLADLVVGAPYADPNGETTAGTSYVVFSQSTPLASATYRGNALNGDAPRIAVGISGDGSNDDSPDARAWIDFDDGAQFGSASSFHEVALNRAPGGFSQAAANVHWQIQTSRSGWSDAELTFRYVEDELLSASESALQIVTAPTVNGPFTALPSVVNPLDNTITTVVDELGFFFIGEAQGEINVTGRGVNIVDGDTTPRGADGTDFGMVVLGESFTRTYTITNEGGGNLVLTDAVQVIGSAFSTTQPASTTLASDESVTFDVTFTPSGAAVSEGSVIVTNDDSDENPYTFTLSGVGINDTDLIFANGFE